MRGKQARQLSFAGRILLLTGVLPFASMPAASVEPARYTIAVFVSHKKPPRDFIEAIRAHKKRPDLGWEDVEAIRDTVNHCVEVLNRAGGIEGHQIDAVFLDDFSRGERTVVNVDDALSRPDLIAMIGISSSSRGERVIDRIGRSGVPFISEMSVETLFSKYPNVYSLTRSVSDEQEVLRGLASDHFHRVAFVGADDDRYTHAYYDFLQGQTGSFSVVSTLWAKPGGGVDAFAPAIQVIKEAKPDLIFLSLLNSAEKEEFLERLNAAGIALPLFVARGKIAEILERAAGRAYGGDMYEIAEGGVANVHNERLEPLMRQQGVSSSRYGEKRGLFSKRTDEALRTSEERYRTALGQGARYSDLVALIAEGAKTAASPDLDMVRTAILGHLKQFQEGKRVWVGEAQNWAFNEKRASSERSLLLRRQAGQKTPVLAPTQYVRRNGVMTSIPVLYVQLDMDKISRVDSNDKSFSADFFFTIGCAKDVPIDAIRFTNAYRSEDGENPLVKIREVDRHRDSAEGGKTRVFQVSGRFLFEPDLRNYPFDEQIFQISFEPASTATEFLIQPPLDDALRDQFRVDRWEVKYSYVGANEQIIRSATGPLGDERVIPYYKFNYTWVMKRRVVDYFLRVIVPLSFIMVVAYLAIFIPRSEFNAIIAIQVTALLSSIALYVALNQPSADDATLSDYIFVVAYATISVMIALSVAEVNPTLMRSRAFLATVNILQIYFVPVVALALISYVIFAASSEEPLEQVLRHAWQKWKWM